VDPARADELCDRGRGVADAGPDDEDVLVDGVERVDELRDRFRREHARPVRLARPVLVGAVFEELVARHRPERVRDRRVERLVEGVLQPVDHVLAERRVVHARPSAPHRIEPYACRPATARRAGRHRRTPAARQRHSHVAVAGTPPV